MVDFRMAREDVQTNLRLPADLKDLLQEAAAKSGRSLSAEVAFRLSNSFKLDDATDLIEANARHVEANMGRVSEGLEEIRRMKAELEKSIEAAKHFFDKEG